ncbi:MAG: hypothetical protein KDC27_14680 [Acidobacteria bacterium]|nr:hypothetical protein [Acidobacteriota bacterium]
MRTRGWTLAPWAAVLLLLTPAARAQRTLDCHANVIAPQLDFEFRFFTGYHVSIPAAQMLGPARSVVLQVSVTPLDREDAEPVRMQRAERAGPIPESLRRQRVEVSGSFVVGEGRYDVLWQMYDSLGAYCEIKWRIEAKRSRGERDLRLSIKPGEVGESRVYLFRPQKIRPQPEAGKPLDLRVFLNLDPWRHRRASAGVRLFEFVPRLAALRALARHPRVGRISLVAYSMEEQSVYLRSELRDEVEFSDLESAIEKLSPAFVSIDQLGKHKPRDFFGELMTTDFPGDGPADAYVFLGPDAELGRSLPGEAKRAIARPAAPVFMLQTLRTPWRGVIGNFVDDMRGREYRFSQPKDLGEDVEDIMQRIPSEAR